MFNSNSIKSCYQNWSLDFKFVMNNSRTIVFVIYALCVCVSHIIYNTTNIKRIYMYQMLYSIDLKIQITKKWFHKLFIYYLAATFCILMYDST